MAWFVINPHCSTQLEASPLQGHLHAEMRGHLQGMSYRQLKSLSPWLVCATTAKKGVTWWALKALLHEEMLVKEKYSPGNLPACRYNELIFTSALFSIQATASVIRFIWWSLFFKFKLSNLKECELFTGKDHKYLDRFI